MNTPGYPIRLVVALALAICVVGCGGHTRPDPPPMTKVLFDCENGESALVRFHTAEELADLLYDGQVNELQQQRTGSGFYYTNGKVGIRGKGDELLLEIGRMTPIRCHATERH